LVVLIFCHLIVVSVASASDDLGFTKDEFLKRLDVFITEYNAGRSEDESFVVQEGFEKWVGWNSFSDEENEWLLHPIVRANTRSEYDVLMDTITDKRSGKLLAVRIFTLVEGDKDVMKGRISAYELLSDGLFKIILSGEDRITAKINMCPVVGKFWKLMEIGFPRGRRQRQYLAFKNMEAASGINSERFDCTISIPIIETTIRVRMPENGNPRSNIFVFYLN
jgi:hypothetical protein